MGDYNVHLVPLTIAPVFLFIIITMLNIIGNVLKSFSYNNGVVNVWFTLWSAYVCSSAGACQLYSHSDFDTAVGISSQCSSFVSHYRAVESFAIIATFFSGILVFFSVVFIVFQQRVGFEGVAKRGMVVSGILFVLDLVTFVLFITLKDRECITQVADVSLEPAPFMYLGGFVFSLVNCGLYFQMRQTFKVTSASASPNAPRYIPDSTSLPQEQQQFSYRQQSPERTVLVVDPRSPAVNIAAEQQRAVSPIRVRSPMSSATRLRGSPVSSGEGLWPDGNDWQIDEPSGLLWSEHKHLFFDRSSGQFFDPKSDQWYDPEADRWYKLQK
jgi:hypothetical protein